METTRPPGFPGNPPARMPRASTPARSLPPRPLRSGDVAFRPTHDVGPRTQCISGLNHAAYGLPVNASRPGSPQAHASLGSGWRPTLAGWDWLPTGFRTRFQRSHHGILSPLTGLSRHTRCCIKDLLRVGRFGPPFSSPQESHCRDAVEGSSHVEDEVPRGELADLQSDPRSTWRCDIVVVLGSDRCLDAPPERPPQRAAALLGSRHRDRHDPVVSKNSIRAVRHRDSTSVKPPPSWSRPTSGTLARYVSVSTGPAVVLSS